MRRKPILLVCGLTAVLGAGTAMASVDDAKTAIKIAHEVCINPGGVWRIYDHKYRTRISDWRAQLEGDTWKVWTKDVTKRLYVLIPRNGPIPTDSNCHSPYTD